MPSRTRGQLLIVRQSNSPCLAKQALVLYGKVYGVISKVFTSANFNYKKQIVPSNVEDVGASTMKSSIMNVGRFPQFFQPVGGAGWIFVWLVAHQSEPVTKYHTAWAVKCCLYRHNCMFCFQPNELRWCVPIQQRNINEKTREEPPSPTPTTPHCKNYDELIWAV